MPPPPYEVTLEDELAKLKIKADLPFYKSDSSLIGLALVFANLDVAVPVKNLDATRNPTNPNIYHYTWEAVDGRDWDQQITVIGLTPADYLVSLDDLTGNWKVPELTAHVAFRSALVGFLRAYEVKTLHYDRK